MAWQAEIEATGIRKAEIARRERLTRARVTQIMGLLSLPEVVKAKLLAGDERAAGMTIRAALAAVAS